MRSELGRAGLLLTKPALAIFLLSVIATRADAQSLGEAQQSALGTSWTLRSSIAREDAANAKLRGSVDSFMPTVSIVTEKPLTSKVSYSPNVPPPAEGPDFTARREPTRYGIQADLQIYDGDQRYNTLQSARSLLEANRQLTLEANQQLLLDTTTAYLAVIRDARIITFRQQQLAGVQKILKGAQTQLALKDATKTDVALAKSRVEDARAGLIQAQADRIASEIEFERLTGFRPRHLTAPALPAGLPHSPEETVNLVRAANPKLKAAHHDAVSTERLAAAARGAILPQLGLQFLHVKQDNISDTLNNVTDTTVKIQAKVPIYQPGALPKIDETQALARQKWFDVRDAGRQTESAAVTLFQRLRSSASQITVLTGRVSQLRATVNGYQIERGAGFRTILDELNGRAEIAQAEIALATAQTERSRIAFALAAMLNRLTPASGMPSTQEASYRPATLVHVQAAETGRAGLQIPQNMELAPPRLREASVK